MSYDLRFEVLTAMKMSSFFWVVMPPGLVGRPSTFQRNILSPSSGQCNPVCHNPEEEQ
jgi:hypothetical protein